MPAQRVPSLAQLAQAKTLADVIRWLSTLLAALAPVFASGTTRLQGFDIPAPVTENSGQVYAWNQERQKFEFIDPGSPLSPSGVTPGTYGDSTHVAQFTVDQYGILTFAQDVPIDGLLPTPSNDVPGQIPFWDGDSWELWAPPWSLGDPPTAGYDLDDEEWHLVELSGTTLTTTRIDGVQHTWTVTSGGTLSAQSPDPFNLPGANTWLLHTDRRSCVRVQGNTLVTFIRDLGASIPTDATIWTKGFSTQRDAAIGSQVTLDGCYQVSLLDSTLANFIQISLNVIDTGTGVFSTVTMFNGTASVSSPSFTTLRGTSNPNIAMGIWKDGSNFTLGWCVEGGNWSFHPTTLAQSATLTKVQCRFNKTNTGAPGAAIPGSDLVRFLSYNGVP